ncbi:MAG: tail fiber domain-containing protein, partial [Flavitalea sp.]
MKKNYCILLMLPALLSFTVLQAQNWINGGNILAADGSIGTNSGHGFIFKTNNAQRGRIYNNGIWGIGNNVTPVNATGGLNLVDGNAVMRILRINGTLPPSVELLSRTTPDGANVAFWDLYAEPSDKSFRIRDRISGAGLIRMTFSKTGNVGIGTTNPKQKLHVAGSQVLAGNLNFTSSVHSIQFANSGTVSNPMLLMFVSGTANPDRMVIGHSPAFPDWGLKYSDATDRFDFVGAGSSKLSIQLGSGNVGIGTTTPEYLLDVSGRIRIKNGFGGTAGLWLNNNENTALAGFVGMQNSTSMGFYGAGYGWSLNTNTNNGFVGVRNGSPLTDLHIRHGINSGYTNGLRIQNEGANNQEWTLYVQNSVGDLDLYKNGVFKGRFDDVSGAYSAISDERLKKDVVKAEAVLDNIMKLGVKRYQFNNGQTDNRKYYGMIAQEVEKVFPDVVFHNNSDDGKDYYTMDYSATSVLAIKGIQELKIIVDEQQEENSKQQEQISQLQDEIAELKQLVASLSGGQGTQTINKGTLSSAVPNPAGGSTSIKYALPEGTTKAQLLLTDAIGRTIKAFHLNSSGVINLDVSSLSSGVYNYSLVA